MKSKKRNINTLNIFEIIAIVGATISISSLIILLILTAINIKMLLKNILPPTILIFASISILGIVITIASEKLNRKEGI